jgi:hypothetical protein
MVYGSETWATKVGNVQRQVRTETAMVRCMCGVTLNDRKSSRELLGRLGVGDVVDDVRRGRLLWFGHVERKSRDDWVRMCRDLVAEGARRMIREKKRRQECVNEDMKQMEPGRRDAQDRTVWRNGVPGKRPNSAIAEKRTLNR